MGVFSGDRFYLIVSLGFVPTDNEVLHLRKLFQRASDILFGATEGRHAIGKVFYAVNLGSGPADICIFNGLSAGADSFDANLWNVGNSVTLYRGNLADVVGGLPYNDLWGDLFDATQIVHELGHYLYGVLDEYIGLSTWACVGDTSGAPTTCLMELYASQAHSLWDFGTNAFGLAGGPSQFCWGTHLAGTHHDEKPNPQNNRDIAHRSCWSWMADDTKHGNIAYGLVDPAMGPVPPAAQPPVLDPLVELTSVHRYGLVLDRSGSMLGSKLDGLKAGGDAFIDLLAPDQQFGIVSFSDTASADSWLADVPANVPAGALAAWETNEKTFVNGLIAWGSTAIGDALDLGRQMLSGVDVAALQSLLLLTDGIENSGAKTTAQVIPDLVARNVRVFTIGFGTDQNAAFLKNLATQTGGESWQVDPSLTPQQIAAEIPRVMMYASGAMRERSMVTAFANIYEGLPEDLEAIPFAWGDASDPPAQPSGPPPDFLSYPIEISAGSIECTMACFWSSPGLRFDLELIRPDGAQATSADISRSVEGTGSYTFHVLEHPMPGTWRLRIRGQEIRGTQFQVLGSQVHPNLRLQASFDRAIVLPGDEVEVQVSVRIPERVPGLFVRAWILSPTGQWSRVKLLERSGEQEVAGIYVARIPTRPDVRGSYLVCIDASRRGGRETFQPFPPSRLANEEDPRAKSVVVPSLRLRKLISFVTDNSGRYVGKPLHGANSKPLSVPGDQAAGVQAWKDRHPR